MPKDRIVADGKALLRLRGEAFLDQKELAEKAGISEHTVMRIERGYTPHSTRKTLRALAAVLNVHPSELTKKEDV